MTRPATGRVYVSRNAFEHLDHILDDYAEPEFAFVRPYVPGAGGVAAARQRNQPAPASGINTTR